MLYTTFELAKQARACETSYRKMAHHLGGVKNYGREKAIGIPEVLEVCGLEDALWALSNSSSDHDTSRRLLRIFACDCAEHVLHIYEEKYPDDKRPRNATKVARRYADGEAPDEELAAAWAAARAAAWAATAAATAAAWAAARAAAGDDEQKWQAEHLKKLLEE